MTFAEAVRTCFQKYTTFEGRARRSEYWWFVLFSMIGSLAFSILDAVIFAAELGVFSPLFSLAIFLPGLCVAVRRLHDRDMSGWWVLLNLIPGIGFIILLVILIAPGTDGPNRFGPDPLRDAGDDDDDEGTYSTSSIPKSGRR